MPQPDGHPPDDHPPTSASARSTALAVIAGLACLACCLVPVLLTAGVLGGAAWIALGRWMPSIALALAAAAGLVWVTARRRRGRRPAGCGTDCRCDRPATTAAEAHPA